MASKSSFSSSEFSEEELEMIPQEPGELNGTQGSSQKCVALIQSDESQTKKRNRPVYSTARRVAANVRERKRIMDYNQAFNALRVALRHDLGGKRLSKISTLQRAINRIAALSVYLSNTPTVGATKPCSHFQRHSQPSSSEAEPVPSYPTETQNFLSWHQQLTHYTQIPLNKLSAEQHVFMDRHITACPPSPHYPCCSPDAQLYPSGHCGSPLSDTTSSPRCGRLSDTVSYQSGVWSTSGPNYTDNYAETLQTRCVNWHMNYLQHSQNTL